MRGLAARWRQSCGHLAGPLSCDGTQASRFDITGLRSQVQKCWCETHCHERRTRCVERRRGASRPPQRSSACAHRPRQPSRTGQQPAKQRRQSCAIAGISQRRLRARERQARARACRRPGGRARRGLAPSSRQPAPDAERGPRSHPRALCVAYQAPSPRVPPVHGRSGRAGGCQSAAGPCRLSLCASAAGPPPRRRARRLSA